MATVLKSSIEQAARSVMEALNPGTGEPDILDTLHREHDEVQALLKKLAGGIHAFTRSLGTHLAPRGIRVNAVAPGPVWTPLNPADKEAQDVSEFGAHTVMKRPAQPEEIAPAYVFLASPQCSSYITGEILPIIGGYSG
jgi:hypothetical protein